MLEKVDVLDKECNSYAQDFNAQERKHEYLVETLKKERNDLKKIVQKFANGHENFEKLLGAQKIAFDKRGIGFGNMTSINNKYTKTYLVKEMKNVILVLLMLFTIFVE